MPALTDIDTFTTAIDVLSKLKSKEGLRISFGVGSFGVDRNEELTEDLLNEFRLSKEVFNDTNKEILMISYKILKGDKKNLIKKLKDKDSGIERKIELMENKFLDNTIRYKYLLNEVYKTNLLDKFDWEVIKYHSDEKKDLNDFPIAVLRFRIKHPFSDTPPVEKTDTFVFETFATEIENLISELSKIRNKLEKVQGE